MLVATGALMFNEDIKIKEAQVMLNENIKNLRKAKGISQEELAIRLNVVRQTVSKNNLCLPACKQKNIATKLRDTA